MTSEVTQEQIVAVLRGERVELEDGHILGWRVCHPDLRSSHDYRWPWPGGVAEPDPQGKEYTHGDPCPQFVGDGVCIAKTWRGAASGGIKASTGLVVSYVPADVLGDEDDKLRVIRARVLEVIDIPALIRAGHLVGSYLAGSNLEGLNLRGSNLAGSNLVGSNLRGSNLVGANLVGANLEGSYLVGSNLVGANLVGSNLRGAYLGDYERGEDGFARLKVT